jgi:putative oxidoreductase
VRYEQEILIGDINMNIKKLPLAIMQRLLGSALLLFGLNNLFHFLPLPDHQGFAQSFLTNIYDAGYIIPIIIAVQVGVGIALLVNRFVPLALIVLFPISLNIFLFHLLHDRATMIPAIIMMAWNTVLIFSRLRTYRPLLIAI